MLRVPLGHQPRYLRQRAAPPATSQGIFVPNDGANMLVPRRGGGGHHTGGRGLARIRNRCKKDDFFPLFFGRGASRLSYSRPARISILNRPFGGGEGPLSSAPPPWEGGEGGAALEAMPWKGESHGPH